MQHLRNSQTVANNRAGLYRDPKSSHEKAPLSATFGHSARFSAVICELMRLFFCLKRATIAKGPKRSHPENIRASTCVVVAFGQ
jgi:hypothetical protein